MDEKEYWDRLEYRLGREFAALKDRRFQHLWCDGFIPTTYLLGRKRSSIMGKVWICTDPTSQEEWRFSLLLPRNAKTPDDIDWAALLPAEKVSKWLSVDQSKRSILIDPANAAADITLNSA